MSVSSVPVLQEAEVPPRPEPFKLVDIEGQVLGQYDDLSTALVEFCRRDEARAISLGNYVVTRRREIASAAV